MALNIIIILYRNILLLFIGLYLLKNINRILDIFSPNPLNLFLYFINSVVLNIGLLFRILVQYRISLRRSNLSCILLLIWRWFSFLLLLYFRLKRLRSSDIFSLRFITAVLFLPLAILRFLLLYGGIGGSIIFALRSFVFKFWIFLILFRRLFSFLDTFTLSFLF